MLIKYHTSWLHTVIHCFLSHNFGLWYRFIAPVFQLVSITCHPCFWKSMVGAEAVRLLVYLLVHVRLVFVVHRGRLGLCGGGSQANCCGCWELSHRWSSGSMSDPVRREYIYSGIGPSDRYARMLKHVEWGFIMGGSGLYHEWLIWVCGMLGQGWLSRIIAEYSRGDRCGVRYRVITNVDLAPLDHEYFRCVHE